MPKFSRGRIRPLQNEWENATNAEVTIEDAANTWRQVSAADSAIRLGNGISFHGADASLLAEIGAVRNALIHGSMNLGVELGHILPTNRCECGATAWEARTDLVEERATPGERVVVANLRGHRCVACGAQRLDAASEALARRTLESPMRANYAIKLSKLSGTRLGLYLPDDVLRVMRLKGGERMLWTPISETKAVVDVERGTPA